MDRRQIEIFGADIGELWNMWRLICSEMGKIGYWLFGAVNGMDRRPM